MLFWSQLALPQMAPKMALVAFQLEHVKREHKTPILASLHWLPVHFHGHFNRQHLKKKIFFNLSIVSPHLPTLSSKYRLVLK